MMPSPILDTLFAQWRYMLVGTCVTLVGIFVGWIVGTRDSFAPVRGIAWWVRHVVLPLIQARRWHKRAAMIFANNTLVLALLVALGIWRNVAVAAIALLGLNLGIALRVLDNEGISLSRPYPTLDLATRRRMTAGVLLNMLEPPAIVIALGLALARGGPSADHVLIWRTFAICVIPALALAAGGEALWLGAYHRGPPPAQSTSDAADPDKHAG